MVLIGDTLREARQRKGLSLADLEEITKIRTHYLNALEEENFEELPGKTYVKGFLRTYARALDLDPQELMDSYNATTPESVEIVKPIEPIGGVKKAMVMPRWLVIAGLCALAALTLFGVSSLGKKASEPTNPPATAKQPVVSTPKTPASPKPQQTQTTSPQTTAPVTTTDTSQLSMGITFTGDCWLQIKADGKQVLQGKFSAGTSKTITASNNIDLVTVGSAGAINLSLNGKALPALGKVGQVVRNKVYTKNNIPQ